MRKSFTLIELIVVIGIIALLSGLGVSTYNGFQQAARDSRRKADLETITNALNAFYAVNGRFPAAGGCAADSIITACSVSSFNTPITTAWIPGLVPTYIEALPVDPNNNATTPWHATNNNYSYAYGGVTADGQRYDLTARLENANDPDRCAARQYRYRDAPATPASTAAWCGTFSGQIYEFSPN